MLVHWLARSGWPVSRDQFFSRSQLLSTGAIMPVILAVYLIGVPGYLSWL